MPPIYRRMTTIENPGRANPVCYDWVDWRSSEMGPVGVQEMIVIFLVALVLFGPKI